MRLDYYFFGNNLDLVLNVLMNHTGVLVREILCVEF